MGGGNVRSYTIGANYSANRFVQFMLDYTYIRLTKDFLPYDKNFHSVQARVQFVFQTTARLIPAFVFSITRVTGRKTRQL